MRNDEFDKRYGLYSSKDPSNLILPDPVKMFNILRAYGNLDHEVFHAQGIAYLVSMLLNYIDSEEDVFFLLCRIMRDLNWRYHFIKPFRMPEIVEELHELISLHVPDLYTRMMKDREDEAGMSDFIENMYNFTMTSLCVGP